MNHLNLHVKSGETIALVGESGAGKSTILNLVIGFNQAESGKVLIDGKDISKIDLRTYRKHLAVVPQTSILFSGTIRTISLTVAKMCRRRTAESDQSCQSVGSDRITA